MVARSRLRLFEEESEQSEMLALRWTAMNRYVSALLVFAPLVGVGVLVGCAEGANADLEESFLSTEPVEAGAGEGNGKGATLPPSSNSDGNDSGTNGDAGGGKGAPDGGGDPKPDAGGGGNGGGGSTTCPAPNACASAASLGTLSGDTGSGKTSVQNHSSQWYSVRVTEDDSSFVGVPLRLTATLKSPPGSNYDLYVYVPSTDTIDCSVVSGQSTNTSLDDTVSVTFGESDFGLANGGDDDRTVIVEVRHVSGTCDPSQKWTLTLNGNL